MKPAVFHAVQQFEREANKRHPKVKLQLIEPMGGADAAFLAIFPTPNWFDIFDQLHDIMLDIEEETDVWINILPEGPDSAAADT